MKNKNKIPKWFDIVNLILVLVGLSWTIYSLINPTDTHINEEKMIQVFIIIDLVVALNYCLVGYKKRENLFYNVFVIVYLISTLLTSFIVRQGTFFLPLMSTLTFGILSVLALSDNLSKKKAYTLATVNVSIAVLRIIVYVIVVNGFPGGMFGNLLLSLILGIMVYNKYSK